jgi:glycosyltransferase involved in cell wall biosynthesis
MKKIKVLQMPAGKPTGGQTRYMLENWRFIDKSLFQFDFATFMPKQDYEAGLKGQGCRIHHFSQYPEDDMPRFCDEFNAVLDNGYDAIHLHTGYWRNFICEELAVKRCVPVIAVHAHNARVNVTRGSLSFEEATALHEKKRAEFGPKLATHFLACSRDAANFLYGTQIPQEKIQVLKNAIDLQRFAFAPDIRKKRRADLGLENKLVLGHVGRFAYQKNHDFLIEIFADAASRLPNAVMLLVGDGELREGIEDKAERFGISGKVRFLGNRADVAELYQAMDLFLLPSNFGGLDLVTVEAQTSGLKCLVSVAMPKECKITDMLCYLPLEHEKWLDAIIEAANGYERRDCSAQVEAAGYSLTEQIKALERIYAGE